MPLIFQSILLVGITCYLLSALLFLLTRGMPHIHRGVGWWALSSIAGAIGYSSLLVYSNLGDPVSGEVFYNLSLISWASFLYIGSHQWLEQPLESKKILLLGFLATLWVVYFNFIQPAFLPSAIVTALTCGMLTLHTGWLFMKQVKPRNKHNWLLVGTLFVSGLHALDYPIMRPIESLAIVGFLLCTFASLTINTILASMVIIQFKNRMQDSKQQAINIAMQDPLTGLKNRLGLTEDFKQLINHPDTEKHRIAVIFADLDDFKIINDTHGHEDGDEVLRIIAARLDSMIREDDIAARIGGDEFVIILTGIQTDDREHIPKFISRLIRTVCEPIVIHHRTHQVGVSIGLSVYPKDGKNLQDLLNSADNSMYLDKRMKKKSTSKKVDFMRTSQQTSIVLDTAKQIAN
ncbi:MAG: GGDEF domain-containing protein [Thiolinea sp.]